MTEKVADLESQVRRSERTVSIDKRWILSGLLLMMSLSVYYLAQNADGEEINVDLERNAKQQVERNAENLYWTKNDAASEGSFELYGSKEGQRFLDENDEQRTPDDGAYLRVHDSSPISQKLQLALRQRIYYSQHPTNCSGASYMTCEPDTTNGFGAQIHAIKNCIREGVQKNFVVVLKQPEWNYQTSQCRGRGFDCYFLPITRCTNLDEMVNLGKIDLEKIATKPPSWIPQDMQEDLSKIHHNPNLWVTAHFVEYLLRPRSGVMKMYQRLKQVLSYRHPILGVHVRGTDKIKENRLFNLGEYVRMVEDDDWRSIYLASDDYNQLKRIENFKRYKWILTPYKIERMLKRDDSEMNEARTYMLDLLFDLYFLAESDFFIGTDSSNIGRVVFELMQPLYVNAQNVAWSVDTNADDKVRAFNWYQWP